MDKRKFGRTGLDVSLLGFGCGAVGGLMIKGAPADQERAVRRALDLGINYFDTAQMYGNGESERNLGRVLKALKPECYVGTKVRLPPTEPGKIGEAIAASLEASLQRLQRDSVDLFQFHNAIVGPTRGADFHREVERARRFAPLVSEGHADSLIEASIRYVIAQPAVSTVLVGYSTMEHLEYAARSIEKGPLSPSALARVAEIQQGFVGEPR